MTITFGLLDVECLQIFVLILFVLIESHSYTITIISFPHLLSRFKFKASAP